MLWLEDLPSTVGFTTKFAFVLSRIPWNEHEASELLGHCELTEPKLGRELVSEPLIRLAHGERQGLIREHVPFPSTTSDKRDTLQLIEADVFHGFAVGAGQDDEVQRPHHDALHQFHKVVEPSNDTFRIKRCGEHERGDERTPVSEILVNICRRVEGVEATSRWKCDWISERRCQRVFGQDELTRLGYKGALWMRRRSRVLFWAMKDAVDDHAMREWRTGARIDEPAGKVGARVWNLETTVVQPASRDRVVNRAVGDTGEPCTET